MVELEQYKFTVNQYKEPMKELGVSLALSHKHEQIKELESEMGKTLFNRNGNSISLTKEGVIFLDYALKYEELEKKVHSDFHATNIYTDTVNIGSTKCIYESHLRKPTLQLMNDKEKSLSVNVRLDHSKLLYSGLNNNIYDIIFSYVKPLDTSSII